MEWLEAMTAIDGNMMGRVYYGGKDHMLTIQKLKKLHPLQNNIYIRDFGVSQLKCLNNMAWTHPYSSIVGMSGFISVDLFHHRKQIYT